MGVLFEISIVCHVFVFVVLADGWGFSLFGGCSGLSAVFSRVRGSSGFSLLLAFLRFGRGGWGSGCRGFSRVRGMGITSVIEYLTDNLSDAYRIKGDDDE